MGPVTALTIIGSIASILGAVWSLIEASKSRRAAKAAEKARDDLIDRRKIAEVALVHSETKRILNVASRVGPFCTPELVRGIDCAEIAREVSQYITLVSEQSEHFAEFFENKGADLCRDLKPEVEALSVAHDFDEKKKRGTNIYYRIQSFLPISKNLSDEIREQAAKV